MSNFNAIGPNVPVIAAAGKYFAVTYNHERNLIAGERFQERVNASNRGSAYWINGRIMEIPAGHYGKVIYGSPHDIGKIVVKIIE